MDGLHEHADLATRVASGDRAALCLLLTEMRPQLRETVSRRIPTWLRRLVDSDDIIQIAYVDVFRRIGTEYGPRNSDSLPRWVTAIALNRARDAIRQERAVKRGGGQNRLADARTIEKSTIFLLDQIAGPDHSPSRSVARREVVRVVHEAINLLPARYQQAIWIVHIEGGSAKQAAAVMNRSERAIHGLCRRGLKLLEAQLRQRTGILTSTG